MCRVDKGCRIQFLRLQLSKKQADNRLLATIDPQSCSISLASTACTRESRRFQGKRIPKGKIRWQMKDLETSNVCLNDTAGMHAGQLEDSENRLGMGYRLGTSQIRLRKNREGNHR